MHSGILLAYLVTFTASFFIMVIELVAGRILAPYIGQHLYSWTSIIGVCLAGISIGAWLGGIIADRYPRRGTLGWILLFAGLLTLAIPIVADTIGFHAPLDHSISLMARIVFYTTVIFLPASIVLGMVSPTVIRLVLRDVEHTGSVVGRIYAFSTVGSIVGTFATGFFLVEEYGTRPLVYAVGAILVIIAPLVGGLFGAANRVVTAVLVLAVAGLAGFYVWNPRISAEHHAAIKKHISPPLGIWPHDVPDLGVRVAEDPNGVRVSRVTRRGPAEEAGLEVDDVIVEIDGRKVTDPDQFDHAISVRSPKQGVILKYRRGANLRDANATLAARRAWFYRSTDAEDYSYFNETSYYTLKVKDVDHRDKQTGDPRVLRELILDNLIHSHSDGDDPAYLAYEYLRIYEELVGWQVQKMGTTKHRQLFVGGGGYTLPRYFHSLYKDCHIDIAEIDPGVTYVAEKYMYAPKDDPRMVTYNMDARLFVKDRQNSNGSKYDFVFGDAFNDLSIPFHLTTKEFDSQLRNLLNKDGLLMSLVIDHVGQGRFLPSFLATMRAAFGDENVVLVIIEKESKTRENIIKYLKEKNLENLIPELESKKLEDIAALKDPKHTDLVAYLEARKADDLTPYLRPTELDYISHDTVIVVASPTKQDWDDFRKYLEKLDQQYAGEGFGKTTVSHVYRPAQITEYLNTRMRAAGWVDRIRGKADRVPWTPIILTDDYAPVDNLTAPMFEQRYGYKKKKAGDEDKKKSDE